MKALLGVFGVANGKGSQDLETEKERHLAVEEGEADI